MEMALAFEILSRIAGNLITKYKDDGIPNGEMPQVSRIEDVLKKWFRDRVLSETDLKRADSALLDTIENLIGSFQNAKGLPIDGILKSGLIEQILKTCLGGETARSNRNVIPSGASFGKRGGLGDESKFGSKFPDVKVQNVDAYFDYFIDWGGTPPKFKDNTTPEETIDLLDQAFIEWQRKIAVFVNRVRDKNDANLVISTRPFDGEAGTLAEATVLTDRSRKLAQNGFVLMIDNTEPWTASKFKLAMMHEIGHLLGLTHSSDPHDLMYDYLTDQKGVSENDVARAKEFGWKESPFSERAPNVIIEGGEPRLIPPFEHIHEK